MKIIKKTTLIILSVACYYGIRIVKRKNETVFSRCEKYGHKWIVTRESVGRYDMPDKICTVCGMLG